MNYGKIEDAFYVMCKSGDHHFTWPKGIKGTKEEFADFLPHAGWKLSKRGYWSCPRCVEKRKRTAEKV